MTEKKIQVQVSAVAQFMPERSSPENNRFLWSYEITIINQSDQIIQLLHRNWRITDVRGKVEEVRGPGVVGLQPIIKPGREFAYCSYCQLTTPQGTMEGNYEMQNLEDQHFMVEVPKFVLTSPAMGTDSYRSKLH